MQGEGPSSSLGTGDASSSVGTAPGMALEGGTLARDDAQETAHVDVFAQLKTRGIAFRRRHRLHGQFLLYGGRIDAGKGCEELLEYFTSYKEQGGDAALVLMGVKLMQIPEVPWVRFAGLLSERERLHALEAATIVVVPSPFESLSLLALEAMAVGTPVLCNGRSEVLVDHCTKSNAGLYYTEREEFIEATNLLLGDERLRRSMGRNGKEYVKRNYRWDVILSKYDRLIGALRPR
jgi:glycosyltransferase involved in cell wall biosynthesis